MTDTTKLCSEEELSLHMPLLQSLGVTKEVALDQVFLADVHLVLLVDASPAVVIETLDQSQTSLEVQRWLPVNEAEARCAVVQTEEEQVCRMLDVQILTLLGSDESLLQCQDRQPCSHLR